MTYEHGLHIDWQTKELINIKLKKKTKNVEKVRRNLIISSKNNEIIKIYFLFFFF